MVPSRIGALEALRSPLPSPQGLKHARCAPDLCLDFGERPAHDPLKLGAGRELDHLQEGLKRLV